MKLYVIAAIMLASASAFGADTLPPAVQLMPDPDLKHPDLTYDYCLDLARNKPEQAIEFSGRWAALGGGEPSKHCQAVSMIGLKSFGEAATRLEALANDSRSSGDLRAGMLAQAAQAWLLEGEPNRAYKAQTSALQLATAGTRVQMDLFVDRAMTLAEGEKYKEAIEDLDAALKMMPKNSDALAFRASAHRHLKDLDAALTDAESAVAADKKNANALLERGTLYQLKGRTVDARKDWIAAIEVDPKSDAADAARAAIESYDFKPDAAVPAAPKK